MCGIEKNLISLAEDVLAERHGDRACLFCFRGSDWEKAHDLFSVECELGSDLLPTLHPHRSRDNERTEKGPGREPLKNRMIKGMTHLNSFNAELA